MTLIATRSTPHLVNIAIHVTFGSLALLLGIVAIIAAKGGALHRRAGRWFLYSITIVLATAVIGLLIFDFRAFLAVVTLLSFYDAFSGYRALQLRGARPQLPDRVLAILGFLSPMLFILMMQHLHRPWAPMLTYPILAGLLLMSAYDLARNFLPAAYLRRTWLQEHLVKMLSAYIAISSAFAATVFPALMPWGPLIPTALGYLIMACYLITGPRKWLPRA